MHSIFVYVKYLFTVQYTVQFYRYYIKLYILSITMNIYTGTCTTCSIIHSCYDCKRKLKWKYMWRTVYSLCGILLFFTTTWIIPWHILLCDSFLFCLKNKLFISINQLGRFTDGLETRWAWWRSVTDPLCQLQYYSNLFEL